MLKKLMVMANNLKAFFTLLLLTAFALISRAQTAPTLRQQLTKISTYNQTHTPEKIFIHTDKWNYNKEDTLWFKAYVFDATLAATSKSGLLYIEIADAGNRVVNRNMLRLAYGIGWGTITLNGARFPEGTYTLRAYTNWQRNFDDHHVFTRQFTIEGASDEDWMINSRFDLAEKEGVSNIKTQLAFVKDNGSRMFAEELRVRITAGNRVLYNTKLTTGVDGILDFDFNLRDKISTDQLNIALIKKTKGDRDVTFNVPVIINRDEKTDLQFMPEGGNMVNGMLNRIAFKAINEEGKGVDVQGSVYNNTGGKVAELKTSHKGIGWFELVPQSNQSYIAKINYNGRALTYPLPLAKPSGVVLKVDNISGQDSLLLTVNTSADIRQAGAGLYLIGQARNTVCYGAMVDARKGLVKLSVPKSAFPTGVARFTLLSVQNQPIVERAVFINHHDFINITAISSKQVYNSRDSVSIEITAADSDGEPLEGTFSVAVGDDIQTRPDTTGDNDLPVKMLLANDLKGELENPAWYFSKGDTLKKEETLDALMLTQAWVKYNWNDVFSVKKLPLKYAAEPEFVVKGWVKNAFGKPMEKSKVVLLSVNPPFALDTTTNTRGEFAFKGISPPDTVSFNLQAFNKRGRMFNVGIELDDFTAPAFSANIQRLIPLYVNIDTSRLKASRTRQMYNEEEAKITGRQLQEVQIKAKRIVKDSKSLVDEGEADFTLTNEEIKAQPKMSLLDLMKKNIPGFVEKGVGLNTGYTIDNKGVVLIIDGITARIFMGSGFGLKQILEYMDADDVKGIEVMTSGKNQIPYAQQYLSPLAKFWEYAFVELTTYSGAGFSKKVPGAFIYRLPFFAAQKEFYSPKYNVKNNTPSLDARSTIFWAPNVVTDNKGKAYVSFYTADKTATYTVNIQGADMEGNIGAQQIKLNVKAINNVQHP